MGHSHKQHWESGPRGTTNQSIPGHVDRKLAPVGWQLCPLLSVYLTVIYVLLLSDWLAHNLELEHLNPGMSVLTNVSFPLMANFRMRMHIRGKIRLVRETSVRACVCSCVRVCVYVRCCVTHAITHTLTITPEHTNTHTHTNTLTQEPIRTNSHRKVHTYT